MAKLDDIIKDMNKKTKEEVVTFGLPAYTYKKIPFTSPRMNYCTFGGLPVGKLIEFYGEEHGGKTTTALDVTIQAQILDLLREIQMKLGTATILVSHDLGVVARVADRVAVMYAGKKS